jgi:hypothetical protein
MKRNLCRLLLALSVASLLAGCVVEPRDGGGYWHHPQRHWYGW